MTPRGCGATGFSKGGKSMDNQLVKTDLVDAILELRQEVERRLQANKYYVAMNKLDELLAAIRPLEVIEAKVNPPASEKAEAEAQPVPEPEGPSEKVWTGLVQEPVVEGEPLGAF
jgi:hypothetical protein